MRSSDWSSDVCSSDANAYMSRGIALGRKGMDEKAVADYARAVELDPDYAQASYNRGVAYQALGRTEEAAQDFRRAPDLMPGHPIIERKLQAIGRTGLRDERPAQDSKEERRV